MNGTRSRSTAPKAVLRFLLGPWPFFPWIVFGAFLMLIILQNIQLSLLGAISSCRYSCVSLPATFAPLVERQRGDVGLNDFDLVMVVGNALATAGVIALTLHFGGRLLRKDPSGSPARLPYLGVLALAAILGGLARVLVLSPIFATTPTLTATGIVPTSIRTFVSITLVQSLCGVLTARYQWQVATATTAMEVVRSQQRLVIESDERAKRQVAELLHDRVQADLLVVAMEIRSAIDDCGDEAGQQRLQRAVDDLERIRTTEVRAASRRLSPAFGTVGLDTALQELADSWEPALRVRVTLDSAARSLLIGPGVPRTLVTAIYRITEQALLNAASHGQAARVDITVAMPTASSIELTISDDGKGLADTIEVRGSGAAIMDAWCEAAHGSWDLQPGTRLGAVVTAVFPTPVR